MGMAMSGLSSKQEDIIGKTFFVFAFVMIVMSALFSYERFFIYEDFPVAMETDCDPASESCFIYVCDPASEECAGDPDEDTWYYKRITKQGSAFPHCDGEDCPEISCGENEIGCEVELCDPEGEEECSDPEDFPFVDEEIGDLTEAPEDSSGMAEEEPSDEEAPELMEEPTSEEN